MRFELEGRCSQLVSAALTGLLQGIMKASSQLVSAALPGLLQGIIKDDSACSVQATLSLCCTKENMLLAY